MRFAAIVIIVLMSVAGQANAQIFTGNTVFMQVQCEIGQFAKDTESIGLDPAMKAGVDFSWTVETSTKVQASVGILSSIKELFGGVTVKQARNWLQKGTKSIAGTFNIHEGNLGACQPDRLQVDIGIHDCLMDSTDVLKYGSKVSCDTTNAVGANVSADGNLSLWKIITVGAGAEYDVATTYTIKIKAPAKKDDEKKETKSE